MLLYGNIMKYWKEYTLIGLAYSFCIFSWHIEPSYFEHAEWFSRSGAIMVLLAVVVEYQLAARSYRELLNSIATASVAPIAPKQPKTENILSKISHVAIILGTVIWGYGDLFFEYIKTT